MRRCFAVLIAFLSLAACAKQDDAQPPAPEPVSAQAQVSDELPGLASPATGIAFWEHPSLAFNSTMLVAGDSGLAAYNMEDGAMVGAVDGFKARGLALSYFGRGAQAAGFAAVLDEDRKAFRFYGIDNQSRTLLPLNGDIEMTDPVRGFCLGRGGDSITPTLYAILDGKVRLYNLAPAADGVSVTSDHTLLVPENTVSCAVNDYPTLVIAAEDGSIYRVTSDDDPYSKPFAKAATGKAGDLQFVMWTEEETGARKGLLLLADRDSGAVSVIDAESGALVGSVAFAETSDVEGVGAAPVFAAASVNFGALYRTGAIAFAAEAADGPSIRLAPLDALLNALSIKGGDPVSPRGKTPDDKQAGITIKTDIAAQPQ